VIALVVALGGCGGGDSSSSATTGGEATGTATQGESGGASGKSPAPSGGLSKAEFVKRANAICEKRKKQSLAKMGAYVKQHKRGTGGTNAALIVEAVKAVFLPGVETQVKEIRALGAPPGDEAEVEDFLTALEEGVAGASEASGSPSAAFGKSFARSAKLAREYGIDGCVYG